MASKAQRSTDKGWRSTLEEAGSDGVAVERVSTAAEVLKQLPWDEETMQAAEMEAGVTTAEANIAWVSSLATGIEVVRIQPPGENSGKGNQSMPYPEGAEATNCRNEVLQGDVGKPTETWLAGDARTGESHEDDDVEDPDNGESGTDDNSVSDDKSLGLEADFEAIDHGEEAEIDEETGKVGEKEDEL